MPTYRARWNGALLAESDATIVVDGYRYFPVASVNAAWLVPSAHQSVCGWKGHASYYDVVVGDRRDDNAAWYYADPKPAAKLVEGYIGFWHGVEVTAVSATADGLADDLERA